MLRLMLLRHAKSARPPGVDDHERPLAERGRQAAPLIGRHMAGNGLVPDLAIVSSARRAQETWALVAQSFATSIVRRDEARIYEAAPAAILSVIREVEPEIATLVLVGHNPGFERLAAELIGGGNEADRARLAEKYPTAGLAVIDFDANRWSDVGRADGTLVAFVTPKSLGGEDD
jgi:phosphohistidine phosphatase